jgi:hypothetical protein
VPILFLLPLLLPSAATANERRPATDDRMWGFKLRRHWRPGLARERQACILGGWIVLLTIQWSIGEITAVEYRAFFGPASTLTFFVFTFKSLPIQHPALALSYSNIWGQQKIEFSSCGSDNPKMPLMARSKK